MFAEGLFQFFFFLYFEGRDRSAFTKAKINTLYLMTSRTWIIFFLYTLEVPQDCAINTEFVYCLCAMYKIEVQSK